MTHTDTKISPLLSCQKIVDAICSFDSARVEAFQTVDGNRDLMGVEHIGEMSVLQNTQVGYFNRVYGFADNSMSELNAIDEFYGRFSRPYFLVVPHTLTDAETRMELEAKGYTPYEDAVFLGRELTKPVSDPVVEVSIEPVHGDNIDEYIALYLDCFEARPENMASARVNMKELLRISGHHLWLVREGGRVKALCASRDTDQTTFLCAGAVHESFRGIGIHDELIRFRLAGAQERGLQFAATWALSNGKSHQNLQHAGFNQEFPVTVYASPAAK